MNRWEYLSTLPYKLRYLIAAHYIKHLPVVIDVGGYKNTVAEFLGAVEVHAIDPLLEVSSLLPTYSYRQEIKDVDFGFIAGRPFGLVVLGFDIAAGPNMDKTIWLAQRASTIVLEAATKHPPSLAGVVFVQNTVQRRKVLELDMDFSGNHLDIPTDSFPPFPHRRMVVLQ